MLIWRFLYNVIVYINLSWILSRFIHILLIYYVFKFCQAYHECEMIYLFKNFKVQSIGNKIMSKNIKIFLMFIASLEINKINNYT